MSATAQAEPARGSKSAWIALALIVWVYALASLRAVPPAVLDEAPPAQFCGTKALARLERIEGEGRPHPIGSAENARVQVEIVAAFAELSLTAEVDEHLAVGANGVVSITRNIVARLPGSAPTKSILVCAHHDSVSAGPGSSDDGVGVAAALEIARVLQSVPDRRNDVVFLIDDGEEAGLIGARAFLDHHPLARDIGVVVNMEARGTNGRAQMFETSVNNRSLVAALARGVPHPSATSVAYEIYKKMPNDTDLTVFKAAGLAGVNFAFIGGVARYHTPRDDVAHLDPRSLQHIGESALGVVKELLNEDLTRLEAGDAVYADVLGLGVIHFDTTWILPLSMAALLVLGWRARGVDRRRFVRASWTALAGCAATVGAAFAIAWSLQTARGALFPWSAHPLWTRLAVLCGSLAAGLWMARLVGRRSVDGTTLLCAARLLCALLGVATAVLVPSAGYLFVFPALAAAFVVSCAPRWERVGWFVPLGVALIFTTPVLIGVEDGFGYGAPVGVCVALVVLCAAPAFAASRALPLATASLVAALGFVVALRVPCFDADAPAWLNLVHEHDARSGTARWIAVPTRAPLPAELSRAAAFVPLENAFEGRIWTGARAGFVAPAAPSLAAAWHPRAWSRGFCRHSTHDVWGAEPPRQPRAVRCASPCTRAARDCARSRAERRSWTETSSRAACRASPASTRRVSCSNS